VQSEPFGGFYDANCYINLTLYTVREVLQAGDPPRNYWEQATIRAADEKRIAERRQRAYSLIAKEEYKSEDINEYANSWKKICVHLVLDFFNEFGKEKILAFFDELLEKKTERKNSSLMGALELSIHRLISTEEGREPTEDELEVASGLCVLLLQYGENKYEKDFGARCLKAVAELGYRKAKDILKFGTGQIPQEIVQYKDKLVSCIANDIEKVVDIKIKEESAAVYRAVVEYLTRLLKNGFPGDYNIKFNSKVKNYIPTELRKTKMNNFFANAAEYPKVHEALKEYARTARHLRNMPALLLTAIIIIVMQRMKKLSLAAVMQRWHWLWLIRRGIWILGWNFSPSRTLSTPSLHLILQRILWSFWMTKTRKRCRNIWMIFAEAENELRF